VLAWLEAHDRQDSVVVSAFRQADDGLDSATRPTTGRQLEGSKDNQTPEGIRVAPAPVLLRTLSAVRIPEDSHLRYPLASMSIQGAGMAERTYDAIVVGSGTERGEPMRRAVSEGLVVACVAVTIACGRGSLDESMAMARGNAQRTGVLTTQKVAQPTEALWRVTADLGTNGFAVLRQRLFFETSKGVLVALDAATGQTLWTYGKESDPEKFNFFRGGTPAVVNDTIYWARDGLHALDVQTGHRKWHVEVGAVGSPTFADGVVYFLGGGGLVAVNADTGQERWRFLVPLQQGSAAVEGEEPKRDGAFSGPVVADGIVYAGSVGPTGSVVAVDAATGQERWTQRDKPEEIGPENISTGLAADDGMLYYVQAGKSQGTSFRAVDARTGQERWRRSRLSESNFMTAGPVIADGTIYLITSDASQGDSAPPSLYALDARTGQERWRHPLTITPDRAYASQIVYIGGTLYFGAGSSLLALDAASGQEQWRFKTEEEVVAGPTASGGVMYFGGQGVLRAIR
jgi:outer membrane protein assembly factor BamB